jgi:hypothetical protein
MKRAAVALAWLVGATVPLLMATVFLFGCCVLPFHNVLHHMMPLCHLATTLATEQAQPATPRAKQEPVKRVPLELPRASRVVDTHEMRAITPANQSMYRSFIAHGAMRCDRDVGLHLLDSTFLI